MRKRNSLFKKTGYSAKFKMARNRVTNLLQKAKANYFKKLNPRDSKKFWKAVKYLKNQQCTIPTLEQGELTASSDLQKAECLNDFFSSCFNRSHPPLMQTPSCYFNEMSPPPEMYCTVDEVEQVLRNLEVSKTSGPDKISSHMLKETAPSIASSITKLFNLFIRMDKIPDQWKESTVLIPKYNLLFDPGNYRPISLACILCKLLEKHVYNIMYDHLLINHQLSDSQWDFRSGRSTVSALLTVTHDWFAALEHDEEVCAVFLVSQGI